MALAVGVIIACTSLCSFGAMRSTVFGSNATFQPLGPEPDSSICSAGAVPEFVSTTGIVVSVPAAARALEACHQVWLAAWVPDPEASFVEEIDRHARDAFDPDWIGKDPTEDDAVAAAFLYHDCDEATLEWALSTRRLFLPRGVYDQRLSLAPEIPSTYVVAAHDRTIRPAWQRRMARERLGVEPMEIRSGHCPNVSRPDRLAEILVDLDRPFRFPHAGAG